MSRLGSSHVGQTGSTSCWLSMSLGHREIFGHHIGTSCCPWWWQPCHHQCLRDIFLPEETDGQMYWAGWAYDMWESWDLPLWVWCQAGTLTLPLPHVHCFVGMNPASLCSGVSLYLGTWYQASVCWLCCAWLEIVGSDLTQIFLGLYWG